MFLARTPDIVEMRGSLVKCAGRLRPRSSRSSGVALKFRLAAQGRWLHLSMAIAMAVGVPLAVLAVGRTLFWLADRFGTASKLTDGAAR
jgi:hypothetical protein